MTANANNAHPAGALAMNQGADMDNRALIERAYLQMKSCENIGDAACIHGLAMALERAEAELAKYRSAPVVAIVEDWPDDFTPVGIVPTVETKSLKIGTNLIIRPEAT